MMTLNGMFAEPKPHRINFIKENKRKLKQISSLVSQNVKCSKVDRVKSQSSQADVGRPMTNSSSKIYTKCASTCKLNKKSTISVFMHDKRKDEVGSTTSLYIHEKPSHKSINITKNQSCQTIDPKNYGQLFHEGVIIYPSSKVLEEIAATEREKANRLDAHVKKDFFKKNRIKSKSLLSKPLTKTNSPETKNECEVANPNEEEEKQQNTTQVEVNTKKKESETKVINKSKKEVQSLNAAEIIRKTTEEHYQYSPRNDESNNKSIPPSNRGDSNSAYIPKTTKRSFVKKNKKDEEILKTVLDPMCPPGHIPLPDQERKKTLHMLRVSYAELIREMNLLPVRTDTLRIRQRKMLLENQLNKIEEGIKVFNKSKVYVKIEE